MALNFEPDWVTIISSSRTSTCSERMRYRLFNPAPSKLNNSLAGSALGTIRARQKLICQVDRLPRPTQSSLSKNEHKKPRSSRPGLLNVKSWGHRPGFFYKRSMSRVTSRLRFIEPQLASSVDHPCIGTRLLLRRRPPPSWFASAGGHRSIRKGQRSKGIDPNRFSLKTLSQPLSFSASLSPLLRFNIKA
jgi:hypothetical protein